MNNGALKVGIYKQRACSFQSFLIKKKEHISYLLGVQVGKDRTNK